MLSLFTQNARLQASRQSTTGAGLSNAGCFNQNKLQPVAE